MSPAQKMKLSAANIGKKLSQETKDKISKSMEEYWKSLPYKPGTGEREDSLFMGDEE